MDEENKDFAWSNLDPKWNKLVEDHWGYVEKVIRNAATDFSEEVIRIIGWHYRGAMLHGIKHALESK